MTEGYQVYILILKDIKVYPRQCGIELDRTFPVCFNKVRKVV